MKHRLISFDAFARTVRPLEAQEVALVDDIVRRGFAIGWCRCGLFVTALEGKQLPGAWLRHYRAVVKA